MNKERNKTANENLEAILTELVIQLCIANSFKHSDMGYDRKEAIKHLQKNCNLRMLKNNNTENFREMDGDK